MVWWRRGSDSDGQGGLPGVRKALGRSRCNQAVEEDGTY